MRFVIDVILAEGVVLALQRLVDFLGNQSNLVVFSYERLHTPKEQGF